MKIQLIQFLFTPLFLASGRLLGTDDRHLSTCASGITCTTDKECSDGNDCPAIEYCNTSIVGGCCERRENPSCTSVCTTDADCDDSNPCTAVDVCDNGTCVYKDFPCDLPPGQCGKAYCEVVADAAQCTVDPATGCSTDGDCEDGDRCTVNSCNLITNCCETKGFCDDDIPCTVDTCTPSATDPPTCDHEKLICDANDSNPCILDECQDKGSGTILGDGTCVAIFVAAGLACDDSANTGPTDGVCNGRGSCEECVSNSNCDDGNECTEEKCDTTTFMCVRADVDGAPCDGKSGVCSGGSCVATTTTTTTTGVTTTTATTTTVTTATKATTTACRPKTASCELDGQCCGGKCRGRGGRMECK